MYSKEIVKNILADDKYRQRKTNFESNKIAQLDLAKLEKVELKSFSQLSMSDFFRLGINNEKWQRVWGKKLYTSVMIKVAEYNITRDFTHPDVSDLCRHRLASFEDKICRSNDQAPMARVEGQPLLPQSNQCVA